MGSFDRFLRKINENAEQNPEESGVAKSFSYLDDLIQGESKEIVLSCDIVLSSDEQSKYSEGIDLNTDGIVINGNGFNIDARGKARIFDVSGDNITIRDVTLKNGHATYGGALSNPEGVLNLDNVEFKSNSSDRSGGAITSMGEIHIHNCRFIDNSSDFDGGAINSVGGGILEIENTEFKNNSAANEGGAILVWGEMTLSDNNFENNSGFIGGAICSQEGMIKSNRCDFISNHGRDGGGAIANHGEIDLIENRFISNSAKLEGGAINCQLKGSSKITKCEFEDNSADHGGAIDNFGKFVITDCSFVGNTCSAEGGAVDNNQDGTVRVDGCVFKNNRASNGGGAIINWGVFNLSDSHFEENRGGRGGAIYIARSSTLTSVKNDFINNDGDNGAGFFNDAKNSKFVDCSFTDYNIKSEVVFNANSLELINCNFSDVKSERGSVILNYADGILDISGGELTGNDVSISSLINMGKSCSVDKTIFKDNVSQVEDAWDIYNETDLNLLKPKFDSNHITVLNNGHIDIRKMSHDDILMAVKNTDTGSIDEFEPPAEKKPGFNHLYELIRENIDDVLVLNEDIVLENYELDFFEGGINLDMDDLVIDGNGRSIDGNNRSRIFIVTGRNVTLRNITFKNGFFSSDFENETGGGGAIYVARGASLILQHCTFMDNNSDDNGGAIVNSGLLNLNANHFIDNHAKNNGGAILNNGIINSLYDEFRDNSSRIAGAIYNIGELNIQREMTASGNSSDFTQDIYNVGSLNNYLNDSVLIYDAGINGYGADKKSFTYLNEKIRDCDEIQLDCDIEFDYYHDFNLKRGITISNDVIIDGNHHVIDGKGIASLFKIDSRVTFKNTVFANAYCAGNPIIENNSQLVLENCKIINNKSTIDENMIVNKGSLKIIDCYVSNNSLKNRALILNLYNMEIVNSNFTNNISDSNGVVAFNKRKIEIKNSEFLNNRTHARAGAIYNEHEAYLNISGCRFVNNSSDSDGGTMVNASEIQIEDSSFHNNSSYKGGAIFNMQEYSILNISGTDFIKNNAHDGGAIMNNGKVTLKNSKFEKNKSKERGGALNVQRGVVQMDDVEFSYNISNNSGGAIHNEKGILNISSVVFTANNSKNEGGAIISNGRMVVSGSRFMFNSSYNGGALNLQYEGVVDVSDSQFTNNLSTNAGAIWAENMGNVNVSNCEFKNNLPDDYK